MLTYLTLLKVLEKGTPLSRAKANSCREFVAMTATHANTPMTSMMHVKPVAPAADPVVLRKT
jgi:hypothetical protein